MHISFFIALAVGFVFGTYFRAWQWVYIPRDPDSRMLGTDMRFYGRLPRFMRPWYNANLAWRRNVSKRWKIRRDWKAGTKPYSPQDVAILEMVRGRPLDPDMRQQLADPKL